MRIHIIACRVFTRELSFYAAQSPHTVDITWLPQGLHDTPDQLRKLLKTTLDDIYIQKENYLIKHLPDAIVLGYGLCSNGIVGLESREIPLIVPRTDDCIALFLGSQQRYLQVFEQHCGTYWLNNGWIETAFIPSKEMFENRLQEYTELYGEDNAEYLLEQDKLWVNNYRSCGYIHSPIYQNPRYALLAQEIARENGWGYHEQSGDMRLLQMCTDGTWNDEEFCICPPYHRLEADYEGKKVRAVSLDGTQHKE